MAVGQCSTETRESDSIGIACSDSEHARCHPRRRAVVRVIGVGPGDSARHGAGNGRRQRSRCRHRAADGEPVRPRPAGQPWCPPSRRRCRLARIRSREWPAPSPSSIRPWLKRSSVAASRASRAGWWKSLLSTITPSRNDEVTSAAVASGTNGENDPPRWSAVTRRSKPAPSTRRASSTHSWRDAAATACRLKRKRFNARSNPLHPWFEF